MLSHSEPLSALRVQLGSLQYRIAQESAGLWVTADMGFTAAKKFAQTLEGAADVSYMSAFKEGLDMAKAAQEAERVLQVQQQATAVARQPKRQVQRVQPAATPAAESIYCYKCGEVGHKANVCTQAFALEDSSDLWEPEVQQAIRWRSDWVTPEEDQNAQHVWPEPNWQEGVAKGTGKSGGKTGGKGKSGTKGFGGYGKSGGTYPSDWGGGKGYGWPTGGRGKRASWPY